MLESSRRGDDLVDETVVHRAQAGRARIAEPGNLQRCRLAREQSHAIARATGQVEEDVDAIAPDAGVELCIGHRCGDRPVIGEFTQAHGDVVARLHVVGEQLEPVAVQARQIGSRNRATG